jgi:hypothetical protein
MTQEEKSRAGVDSMRASRGIQHYAASGSVGWSPAKLLFSVALLLAAPLSGAELGPSTVAVCPPAIQWQLGLGDDTYQRFHRILNRSDGGYIVGGQYFGRDEGIWLVALLPNGSNAWQRFYGATGSHYLNDLQPTKDGGYILAGTARLPGNNEPDYQAELTRINANGDVLWTRTYGGSDLDAFQSARQTKDGGFVAAGSSWAPTGPDKTSPHYGKGDAWIVKLDAGGNKIWERSYGGTGLDGAGNTVETADGNYLVSISSDSPADGNKSLGGFGGFDSWILKLDPEGHKIWERVFGTTNHDGLELIDELPNGRFLLSGYASAPAGGNKTSPSYGGSDAWVVLIDANGDRIWERSFGGTDSDGLYAGQRMADGGYILAGYSQSPISGNKTSPKLGGNDMWLVRLDSTGNKVWERTIGGGNPYGSSANGVAIAPDGGFIVAGETFNDIGGDKIVPWLGSGDGWVVKLGPENDACDTDRDGVPNNLDQCPDTPPGATVNTQGCSIPQLCPCDGPWRNHGEYVRSVTDHAWQFYREDLISAAERRDFIRDAATSDCGRRHGVRLQLLPQTIAEVQQHGRQFIATGDLTGGCVLESSTNLIHWSSVATNWSSGAEWHIAEPARHGTPTRFYRLRVLPQ